MVPAAAHSPMRDKYPRGGIDVSIRDLIRAAIVESDGTASDVLLRVAGGGPRVTAYLRGLGIRDMTVATSEADMTRDYMVQYRNYSTPQAAVELLKALWTARTLTPASRQLLLDDLVASTPGPKRLKGLLPPGTVVAHKTGTDGTRDGVTRATNDVGLITLPGGRQLAIAVFIKDSTADEAAREAAIAKIARAAWDRWGLDGSAMSGDRRQLEAIAAGRCGAMASSPTSRPPRGAQVAHLAPRSDAATA